MDTKDKTTLVSLRREYEESGLKVSEFAEFKGMEYWKVRYALRKALQYKKGVKKRADKVKFTKLAEQPQRTPEKELRIKTSYGAEIIIPL